MGLAASCGSRKLVANHSYGHHVTSYPAKERMETHLTDNRQLDRDLTDNRQLDRDLTDTGELDKDLTDTGELDRDLTDNRQLDRDLTDNKQLDRDLTENRQLDKDLTDTGELDRDLTDNRQLDRDLTDTGELEKDLTDTGELDRDLTDNRQLDRDVTDTGELDKDLTDTGELDRDWTDTKLLGRHLTDERQLEDVRQVLHNSPHLMVTVQNILELTESASGELKADILSLARNSPDRQLVEEVLNMTDFSKQTIAMFTSGHRQTNRQTDRHIYLQLWNILSGSLPRVITELSANGHLQHLSEEVIRWLQDDDGHPQPREQIETLKILWGASQHPEGALWVPDPEMEAVLTGLVVKHQGQEELTTWLEILLTSGLDETRQQFTTAGYGMIDKMISQLRHHSESQDMHNVSTKDVLQVVANLLNDEKIVKRFDQKGGLELIEKFLTSPDPEIQVSAAECLYQLGWNPGIWHRLMESQKLKHLLENGLQGSLDPNMKDVCIRLKVLGKIHKLPLEKRTPELSTNSPSHVMLSYNWNVKDTIKRIDEKLKEEKNATWLDTTNMGDHLLDSMAEAVEQAYVVVIAATKKYQLSKNCKLEAKYADIRKKRLIFVMLDDYTPTGWLGLLRSDHLYIKFTPKNFDDAMEQLIRAIQDKRGQKDEENNLDDVSQRATQLDPSKTDRATEKVAEQLKARPKSSPGAGRYGGDSSTPSSENSSARGSTYGSKQNTSMASVEQGGHVDLVKGHKNGGLKDRASRNQQKQERRSRKPSCNLVQVPTQSDSPVFKQPIYCPAYYFINWTIGSSKVDGCRKGCPDCLLQQVNSRGHDPFSRYNVTHKM